MSQWHLKKYDDGSVFGPVDVTTLKDWASKGEISPYDMLSRDGVKWMAAPELQDLDMNWIVEFPDGEMYGPTCVPAIRAFLVDGQLTAENTIRNATSGEKCFIGEHPDFQDLVNGDAQAVEPGPTEDEGDNPVAEEETVEEPAAEEEPVGDDTGIATATDASAGEDLEILHQRVSELEEASEKVRAAHEASMQKLTQELVTARTQEQFLRSELELLKKAADTERAAKNASEGEVQSELAKMREQFELLSELNGQLQRNYEDSVTQINRKLQETLEKLEQDAVREAELNRQVAEAAHREAQYREQIIAMERELVKTQQAQTELLGKYSALNDKLTQYLSKARK